MTYHCVRFSAQIEYTVEYMYMMTYVCMLQVNRLPPVKL